MYAPRPSLSQLTTTFIGSQAKPSPRQYKVAYILNKQYIFLLISKKK